MTHKTDNPNPYYCVADVHNDFGVDFHQCDNKPKKDSEWCGTHSPEAQAKRDAKSAAHYAAWSDRILAPGRELERLRTANTKLTVALANVIQSELLKQPRKTRLRFVNDGIAVIEEGNRP